MTAVNSFVALMQGNVAISGLKAPEQSPDGNAANDQWIIRLYETVGSITSVTLRFAQAPTQASFVDLNEQPVSGDHQISINGNHISFEVQPAKIVNLCVQF